MDTDTKNIALLKRNMLLMTEHLMRCTTPLMRWAREHDHARAAGSGFFLEVAGQRFLVSARHVFEGLYEGDSLDARQLDDLWVMGSANDVVAVGGTCTIAPGDEDVAVLRLEGPTAQQLGGKEFLRLDDLDTSDLRPPASVYQLAGWPEERCRKPSPRHFDAEGWLTVAKESPRPEAVNGYRARSHLVVDIDLNDVLANNPPDSMKGMSGSAIWRVHRQGEPLADWDRGRVRVVGVQSGVTSDGHLWHVRAVRAWVVAETIGRGHPALRPFLARAGLLWPLPQSERAQVVPIVGVS